MKEFVQSKAEMCVREKLANNGRNPENNNAGIRVGSDLHLCEVLLADLDRLREEYSTAGWQPIETAPKDGTWILAQRPSAKSGIQQTIVAVTWDPLIGVWVWPTDIYDAHNPPDLSARDSSGFIEVDSYESNEFTHWMPLPTPPRPHSEREDG